MAKDTQTPGRILRALAQFERHLDQWMAMRDNASVADLLTSIVETTHYREMLEKQEMRQEAENRIANIEELIRAGMESQQRGETVFEFLDRASLSSELDHFDPNARVTLMTVHSAKGLEFDVVFLAGMEEGLFPHALSSNSVEELEEERRLCYVAITRAKQKLFLTWTPFRRSFGPSRESAAKPSRFLGEMPAGLVEGLDLHPDYAWDEEEEYATRPGRIRTEAQRRRKETGSEEHDDKDIPRSLSELRAYIVQKQAATQPGTGPVLKLGMRVRHAQFGDGVIIKRERSGNDMKLTITFTRVGRKTLVERYARLEVL
jgi:DNA helicase-2/ATP-dependent DNA helicase PcrA